MLGLFGRVCVVSQPGPLGMIDSSDGHAALAHSDNDVSSREFIDEEREDDYEDDAENDGDGIQLGLLSRKTRAGKERALDGSSSEKLTTRQLAIGILAEVSTTNFRYIPMLIDVASDGAYTDGDRCRNGVHWRVTRKNLGETFSRLRPTKIAF